METGCNPLYKGSIRKSLKTEEKGREEGRKRTDWKEKNTGSSKLYALTCCFERNTTRKQLLLAEDDATANCLLKSDPCSSVVPEVGHYPMKGVPCSQSALFVSIHPWLPSSRQKGNRTIVGVI
jgi:hypothetical protein